MIEITFPIIENQSAESRKVVNFYTAIFHLDESGLFQLVTDDCTYVVYGVANWEGKTGLTNMLDTVKKDGPARVRIENIVADTKHAAIKGTLTLRDGSQLSCAEFLTFSQDQKIRHVDAYVVAIPNNEKNNKQIVSEFNDYITNRNIEGLGSAMSDDHIFIDSANTLFRGKEKVLEAWRRFFEMFPEYRNIFEHIIERNNDMVVILGRSLCPNNKELNGPAIWSAKLREGKVSEWRVYEDTLENRNRIGIKLK